jgi:predicted amidophosphoribosyltransferase
VSGLSGLRRSDLVTASDDLRNELVPIPKDRSDVCPVCRSWRHERWDRCSNCLQALSELSEPCDRVIPLTLYARPSCMRDWLKFYKEGSDSIRQEYSNRLTIILDRFLQENLAQLYESVGGYDFVAPVPSTQRIGKHPLGRLLARAPEAFGAPYTEVLKRGTGELGRRVLSDLGFVATSNLCGTRALLIDDVYTTGSRAQSAASAVTLSGGRTAAIFVFGRRVDPEFNLASGTLWSQQKAEKYEYKDALSWLVA